MKYQTCGHCAVAIENGDLSGLESFYGVEDMARIVASIESMGLVTMIESIDPGWYFDCFVCSEVCLGEIFIFEPA